MKDTQLLIKKDNLLGKYTNIYPKTYTDAIIDKLSGKSLHDILLSFNMYFLNYTGNTATTRLKVPTIVRKRGLWITYVKYDNNVYTEWYTGEQTDDTSWLNSANWRIGNNTLVGDITISANGNWVINGTETKFKAVGENGNTPLLKVANNRLQVSYDLGDTYRDVTNNPVYTKFRWAATSGDTQANNVGRIQASTDEGKSWTNMSNDFTNNLHISRYIGINDSLPTSGIAEGTIYAKGPYYAEGDTLNANPIYRLWVYAWKGNTLAWQDNGEFTGIAAGIVQETGESENAVMSQKAITKVTQALTAKSFVLYGNGVKYLNKNISKNDSTRTPVDADGWISLVVDIFNGFKFYIKGTGGTFPVLWFATNSQNVIFANSGEATTFDGEVTLSNTDASKLYVNLNLTADPDSCFEILSDMSKFASGELLEKTDISNSVSFEGHKIPNETGVANLHTTAIFSTINLMGMGVKYLNKQIKVNTPSYVPNDMNGWICADINVYQGFRFYINGKGASFPELWFSTDDNGTILQRSGQNTAYNGIIILYHPNTKKLYVNLNTATVQESQLELLPNSDYPQLVKSQNLKQSLQNFISTKQDGDLISHDATIQYYNKKLYVVSMVNQHDTGDSGEFSDYSFLRLDIYNANDGVGSKINSIVVAKPNDVVGDTTILGGCGVPNAKITGSTLHILVGCKLASDGKWRILHYAYDCTNDSLSEPTVCKMDGVDMTGSVLANHSSIASDFNYQMSINASFARVYIGNYTFYYACLASAQRIPNGLMIRTLDFINWEFVKEPTEMTAHSSYEIAMGSYNNNIYLAYRQLPTYGTCVIGMYKTDGTFVDKITIPADDSRPQFFDMPDGLYLLVAKDSRRHARIYKLDNNSLVLKDIAIAWTGERYCGNYLEFLPIGKYQYYCQSNLIDNVLQVCIGGTRALFLTFDDTIINSLQ